MINKNKLKIKMLEKGLTVETLAKQLNVNKSTLYRKMNGSTSSFTVGEASEIATVLNLDGAEFMSIFFASFVA